MPVYVRIVYAIMFVIFSAQAHAEVRVPENDAAAQHFYEKSQLIISKKVIDASDLAGCLILRKSGEPDQFLNILPENIRQTLKQQNLSTKPYRTMLNQQEAAKVGFLGLLGISTQQDYLLEIAINDVWRLEGPNFMNFENVKTIVLQIGKIYYDQGYTVLYNQSVQYALLVTSQYKRNESSVQGTFTYVAGDGKKYVQEETYTQKELISTAPFDISPLLVKIPGGSFNFSALKISHAETEKLRSKGVTASVLSIVPADFKKLESAAKKLKSKDLMMNIQRLRQ